VRLALEVGEPQRMFCLEMLVLSVEQLRLLFEEDFNLPRRARIIPGWLSSYSSGERLSAGQGPLELRPQAYRPLLPGLRRPSLQPLPTSYRTRTILVSACGVDKSPGLSIPLSDGGRSYACC